MSKSQSTGSSKSNSVVPAGAATRRATPRSVLLGLLLAAACLVLLGFLFKHLFFPSDTTITVVESPNPGVAVQDDWSFVERTTGATRKLSEFRGKHILLINDSAGIPDPSEASRAATFKYWFGEDPSVRIIVLNASAGQQKAMPSVLYGERPATRPSASSDIDTLLSGNLYVLISPDGAVVGKDGQYPRSIYGILDERRQPRSYGEGKIVVTAERNPLHAGPALRFPTIPPIQSDDAARTARFKLVGRCRKADWVGGIDCLHDGLAARFDDNDRSSFGMHEGQIEGRFSVDLLRIVDIGQINTFSWHNNGGRCEQLYRVYACRGDEKELELEPALGIDPCAHGWTFLANVDTRTAPGGRDLRDNAGFQQAVGIKVPDGSVGKWRHLLFVCLPTETASQWGQTFFCEVDVIERN